MKKTISVFLAVLMLVGCMSVCFSASAAGDTLTVLCPISLKLKDSNYIGVYLESAFVQFIKNRGTDSETDVTSQYVDNNDPLLFSDDFALKYNQSQGSSFVTKTIAGDQFIDYNSNGDYYYPFFAGTRTGGHALFLSGKTEYESVEFEIDSPFGIKFLSATKARDGSGWSLVINKDQLDPSMVGTIERIDVDFTANPTVGARCGSDYSADFTITVEGASKYAPLGVYGAGDYYTGWSINNDPAMNPRAVLPGGVLTGLPTNQWFHWRSSAVTIVDNTTGTIAYPGLRAINYAPSTETKHAEDPDAELGDYNTTVKPGPYYYEAGKEYDYYATIIPYDGSKFTENTEIYVNGYQCGNASWAEYYSEKALVFFLDMKDVTQKVSAVNIDFSFNPQEGKPVGSDYDITITADPDAALKEGRPLINLPADPANILGTYDYNAAYVAIYESNNLLYPGYKWRTYNTAPQKVPASGSDPTGALGNRGDYSAGNYALGKTYNYFAIFSIDDARYAFDSNTVFNVNGVKATDVTLRDDGKSAQVLVGTNAATVAPHEHSLIHYPAVAATTDKEGNVEYWHCNGCGKNFGDSTGTNELTKVTIDKLPKPVDPEPEHKGSCKYCGQDHPGFAGFFVKIIHSILALFGLRKK